MVHVVVALLRCVTACITLAAARQGAALGRVSQTPRVLRYIGCTDPIAWRTPDESPFNFTYVLCGCRSVACGDVRRQRGLRAECRPGSGSNRPAADRRSASCPCAAAREARASERPQRSASLPMHPAQPATPQRAPRRKGAPQAVFVNRVSFHSPNAEQAGAARLRRYG